ncbi:MAG: hypothetical protein GY765_24320, partial [bacterium]|nr:hypothetical protein [bacterium]
CGSLKTYRDCCRPHHKGLKHPKTAEALMRARYSAYAKERRSFILDTWHPSTRPADLTLEPALQWTGLEILSTKEGSENESIGSVTFTARFSNNGLPGILTEASDFVKEFGRWFYVKGEICSLP